MWVCTGLLNSYNSIGTDLTVDQYKSGATSFALSYTTGAALVLCLIDTVWQMVKYARSTSGSESPL
jgi:hypothetical protein